MRVLVVEDDPVSRTATESFLSRCDQVGGVSKELVRAGTLADAVAALRGSKYDCVVLDLGLPDSHGLATFRSVQRSAPEVPVVVLTGADEQDVGLDLIRAGAQEFVNKRYLSAWVICRAVNYAVERHKWRTTVTALSREASGPAADVREVAAKLRELSGTLFTAPDQPADSVQVESLLTGGAVVTVPPGGAVQVKQQPPG